MKEFDEAIDNETYPTNDNLRVEQRDTTDEKNNSTLTLFKLLECCLTNKDFFGRPMSFFCRSLNEPLYKYFSNKASWLVREINK